jgi:hypothetical protein
MPQRDRGVVSATGVKPPDDFVVTPRQDVD